MVMPRSFSISIESSTCASIFTLAQAAAELDQTISERGLAMVNVGDNGKIADQILGHSKTGTFPCPARDAITMWIFNGF